MWLRVFTATISRRLNGYTLTLWSNVAFIVRNDLTSFKLRQASSRQF